MVAEQLSRPMSLEEAVQSVYESALSGASVADTASVVAHDIDDRDIYEATVIGLAELVHRRLARRRHGLEREGAEKLTEVGNPIGTPRAQQPNPHAAKVLWDAVLDDANYVGADGKTRKALREFTIEDARRLSDQSRALADGHIRVRDAMDRAVGALSRTGAATIGALPLAERRTVVEVLS